MKKQFSIYSLLGCLLFFCTGCEPDWDFGSIDFEPQIIVEGWIEDGEFAHVILSQSKTLNMELDSAQLFDIPIRWAKVTVSDGAHTEVLTGQYSSDYIPPYLYKGNKIRGEAGKSYHLTIEYSGRTVTATTSIPQPIPVERLVIEKSQSSDTLYQIRAYFNDHKEEKNYYKIFTKALAKDLRFFSSTMSTFDDSVLTQDEETSLPVYRGFRHTWSHKYTPFFFQNEVVHIKFSQVPKEGFDFWSSYENEITNSKNPIFPSNSNLKSNINGGYGIWCGYGATTYRVVIR